MCGMGVSGSGGALPAKPAIGAAAVAVPTGNGAQTNFQTAMNGLPPNASLQERIATLEAAFASDQKATGNSNPVDQQVLQLLKQQAASPQGQAPKIATTVPLSATERVAAGKAEMERLLGGTGGAAGSSPVQGQRIATAVSAGTPQELAAAARAELAKLVDPRAAEKTALTIAELARLYGPGSATAG